MFLSSDTSRRRMFLTMLVFAAIGLIASFVLSVEKVHLLREPDAVLSCSLNVVVNCSTVMKTWQAELFGFPNSFIGMMGYSVVVTVAVLGLCRAQMPRWFWKLAAPCFVLGLIFSYWLFFTSVYVIQVLCPWCLVVTLATTMVTVMLNRFMLAENILGLSTNMYDRVQNALAKGYDKVVVAAWLFLMVVLVLLKFGDSLFL